MALEPADPYLRPTPSELRALLDRAATDPASLTDAERMTVVELLTKVGSAIVRMQQSISTAFAAAMVEVANAWSDLPVDVRDALLNPAIPLDNARPAFADRAWSGWGVVLHGHGLAHYFRDGVSVCGRITDYRDSTVTGGLVAEISDLTMPADAGICDTCEALLRVRLGGALDGTLIPQGKLVVARLRTTEAVPDAPPVDPDLVLPDVVVGHVLEVSHRSRMDRDGTVAIQQLSRPHIIALPVRLYAFAEAFEAAS